MIAERGKKPKSFRINKVCIHLFSYLASYSSIRLQSCKLSCIERKTHTFEWFVTLSYHTSDFSWQISLRQMTNDKLSTLSPRFLPKLAAMHLSINLLIYLLNILILKRALKNRWQAGFLPDWLFLLSAANLMWMCTSYIVLWCEINHTFCYLESPSFAWAKTDLFISHRLRF